MSATIVAIRSMEAAGGEVLTAAADVADERAMRQALDAARDRWGTVDGVFHAAGVADGGVALLSSAEDTDRILSPKVEGISVLAKLLGAVPLDLVVLYSSASAILPTPGAAAYSSANAYLDAFVESSERPAAWRRVVSIDWDAWSEAGSGHRNLSTAPAAARFGEFLRSGIPTDGGLDALGRAIASGLPRLVVTPREFPPRGLSSRRAPHPPTASTDPSDASRPDVPSAYEPPSTETERQIEGIWSDLLGIDKIGRHDDFFELGGHSLLATRVLARVEEAFGSNLGIRAIFEHPTVEALAAVVDEAGARGQTRQTPKLAPAARERFRRPPTPDEETHNGDRR
jgi:acyl carrier protein